LHISLLFQVRCDERHTSYGHDTHPVRVVAVTSPYVKNVALLQTDSRESLMALV
jgi:hypothetical protein